MGKDKGHRIHGMNMKHVHLINENEDRDFATK